MALAANIRPICHLQICPRERLSPRTEQLGAASGRLSFFSIQYLRALAALGVVLIHGSTSLLPHDGALLPLNIGNAGVDLFFIISGFLMFYTTANKTVSTLDFYVKRMIRVVPMYFLASTLAFGLALALPQFTRTFSPRVADYVRSILFIPYYNTVSSTGRHTASPNTPGGGPGVDLEL